MILNLGVAGLFVIIACGSAPPVNAESVKRAKVASFADTVADPTGLMPGGHGRGEPVRVSEDDQIGREPISKTLRLYAEANTVKNGYWFIPDTLELFVDSVVRSRRGGDNIAYQLYKRFQRELHSPPPDATFDAKAFVARHRNEIPGPQEPQFHLASSDGEARLILQDMQRTLEDQEMLVRRAGRPPEYRRPVF
jgi:hypothetical protein